MYAYAANRPHRLVDPAGLLSSEDLEMRAEHGLRGVGVSPAEIARELGRRGNEIAAQAEVRAGASHSRLGVPRSKANALLHLHGGQIAREKYGIIGATCLNVGKEAADATREGQSVVETFIDTFYTQLGASGALEFWDARLIRASLLNDRPLRTRRYR